MIILCQFGAAHFRALAMALFLAAVQVVSVQAGELVGQVVGVIDGDTVDVLDAQQKLVRVRLAGIDAPEKAMPFGERAKHHLSEMTYKKYVRVVTEKSDRYGRAVGKIMLNEQDINLQMIKAGLAWHYKQYSVEQSLDDRQSYADAEDEAKRHGVGLWSVAKPIPPWEWRSERR